MDTSGTVAHLIRFIVASEIAMQWLQVYATENGDKLPNATKILLPSSVIKCLVYNQFVEYKGYGYTLSRSTMCDTCTR